MLQSGLEESGDVVVIEVIVGHATVLPPANDTLLAHSPQVVTNRRLAQCDHHGQVTNAEFPTSQCLDNAKTRRTRKELKEICEVRQIVLGGTSPANLTNVVLVHTLDLTDGNFARSFHGETSLVIYEYLLIY
jgi:hypothetical protein